MRRDAGFSAAQSRHFAEADAAHFEWQTAGPGFAPLEAELLQPVGEARRPPYLEIGCGEGGNFVHVGGAGLRIGVDAFPAKLAFARRHLPDVCFAAADAAALPLAAGSMQTVLVRDVLHHLLDPAGALSEAVRVLAPDGTLIVIEPNGANPLVALQARLVAAERGLRQSRRAALEALLAAQPVADVRIAMAQALPLRRLVLHYRFGLPGLGRVGAARRALAAAERASAGLLPRSRWSYFDVRCRRLGQG
jgi:SAM-dependent methyltransferase